MLKSRTLIVLGILLVALVAISLIQSVSHKRSTSRSHTSPVLTGAFAASDLQKIQIGIGTEPAEIVLENLPDGWVVRTAYSHKANQSRVDNLLQNLSDLQGEFRSDAEEVLPDYGFTDSTTVTITGYAADGGDPVFQLEVGKKPERSVGSFIKVPGSSAVYLTSKSILGSLGMYGETDRPKNKHFYDLEVHRCDRLEVDAITLYDGDSVVALQKEFAEPEPAENDTTGAVPEVDRNVYEWKITQPQVKTALKTRGDGVLGALATIRAVDIADPEVDLATYDLAKPAKRATIRLQDGTERTFLFGAKREGADDVQAGYYVQVAGDSTVWVVSEYLLNNIFKSYKELLPEDT